MSEDADLEAMQDAACAAEAAEAEARRRRWCTGGLPRCMRTATPFAPQLVLRDVGWAGALGQHILSHIQELRGLVGAHGQSMVHK